MKQALKIIALLVLILGLLTLVSSCKVTKTSKSTDTLTTRYHDSTILKTVVKIKDSTRISIKDSTVIIPKTVISGRVSTPCDSLGKLRSFDYYLGAGENAVHIWTADGSIHFESKVDSMTSVIKDKEVYIGLLRDSIQDAFSRRDSSRVESKTSQTTTTKSSFRFGNILKLIGLGLILLIVGFVAGKFIKIGIFGL